MDIYIYDIYIYDIYIYICMIYMYIWSKMELQSFSNSFLKIKRKEAQINLITKDKSKSSKIHKGESITKSSDCEKLLGIKIDSKLHFR